MTAIYWWMANYKSMAKERLQEEIRRLLTIDVILSADEKEKRLTFLRSELALRGAH